MAALSGVFVHCVENTNQTLHMKIMETTKQYIGKGKMFGQFENVRVSINVDEVLKYAYAMGTNTYVTFVVSKMKEADKFGKTHTVFVEERNEAEPTAVAEPAPEGGNTAEGVADKPKRKLKKA